MFPNKGRGVIADKSFVKDDFIVEYSGDSLTSKEWKTREKAYKENSEIVWRGSGIFGVRVSWVKDQ
jgi:SET domain-containing protein